MAGICPQCGSQMKTDAWMGVSFDACPACAGLWVNPDELSKVMKLDSEAFAHIEARELPDPQSHGPLALTGWRCPDDGHFLQQYHYMFNSPVVLHNCTLCSGFFVEDGQLLQMEQVIRQSNTPTATKSQVQTVLAEAQAEHDAFMYRQAGIQTLFGFLSRYVSGGWGLF